MDNKVIMPVLGMNQDTGLIAEWSKKLGDFVEKGEVLFTVETDKATQEIESLNEGYLSQILFEEGEEVPVGDVIALLTETQQDNKKKEKTFNSKTLILKKLNEEIHKTVVNVPIGSSTFNQSNYNHNLSSNKILASPKAKKIAKAKKIDLKELVKEGKRQPFHANDIIDYQPSIGNKKNRASLLVKVSSKKFLSVFDQLRNQHEELELPTFLASVITGAARFTNLYSDDIYLISHLEQNIFLNADLGSLKSTQNNKLKQNTPINGAEIHLWNFVNNDIKSFSIESTNNINLTLYNKNNWSIYVDFDNQKLNPVSVINFVKEILERMKQPLRQLL